MRTKKCLLTNVQFAHLKDLLPATRAIPAPLSTPLCQLNSEPAAKFDMFGHTVRTDIQISSKYPIWPPNGLTSNTPYYNNHLAHMEAVTTKSPMRVGTYRYRFPSQPQKLNMKQETSYWPLPAWWLEDCIRLRQERLMWKLGPRNPPIRVSGTPFSHRSVGVLPIYT